MNGTELMNLILTSVSFKEMVEPYDDSKRGNIYEKVWSLVFLLGLCELYQNSQYDFYAGNSNYLELIKIEDIKNYIENISVYSKGKGGASDVTLRNKITKKWVFFSSKFYVDDDFKSVKDYDLDAVVCSAVDVNIDKNQYDVCILVNDKKKVHGLIKNSHLTSRRINMIKLILGLGDLESYFERLKKCLLNVDEISRNFHERKVPFAWRFHQDLITHQQLKMIETGKTEFLLGAKARSGKTYCVGGLFIKYIGKFQKLNALIITPAPTETISQFTTDLFWKYREFNGINVIEVRNGTDLDNIVIDSCAKNIIIVSKQLIDGYCDKNVFGGLEFDIIVFDENHFHGTSQMSKDIIKTYSTEKTVKLFLTATYAKPLQEWNIHENCQQYWDVDDEKSCKERNITALIDKHGLDVNEFVNEANANSVLGVYDVMPTMQILTNLIQQNEYDDIKNAIKDTSYGFSMKSLFSTTHVDNDKDDDENIDENIEVRFNHEEQVDKFLELISGHGSQMKKIPDKNAMFNRISEMSKSVGSRTKLSNDGFTSQLWFLPFGQNLLIDDVSVCLKKRMEQNYLLKRYEILIVNSKTKFLCDIKSKIRKTEEDAKKDGKLGLIILAGNQLTLGITLPYVDTVFLLNDCVSSDKIIQMMFRCMTEAPRNDDDTINTGRKKYGYVVDMKLSRLLNTAYDMKVYKKNLNLEDKVSYMIKNELINIDSDIFVSKENKTELVKKLMAIWKGDPVNDVKFLLKKIENEVVLLDVIDQVNVDKIFTSSVGEKKKTLQVKFDDNDEDQILNSGRYVVRNIEDETEDKINNKEVVVVEKNVEPVSFCKDVLYYVIPLCCILTMSFINKNILDMLKIIKNDTVLQSIFEEQTLIWWNKPNIVTLVDELITKYIPQNSSVCNIAIQFKMSMQNLIDKPIELLELINSCLKPKDIEKKKFGEVFTPIKLIDDMINNLDLCYTKDYGVSIFTQPKLKWLDPAAGMGNFPVAVYLRLIDGLKQDFPDEKIRKAHILKNMLYMTEINQKNCFIIKQIFGITNDEELNLYEGDTLKETFDTKRLWGIDKFDVILGNPPFQQQVGPKKTETLWDKFFMKSLTILKSSGYLVYVHPSGWRNIDGKFKKVQEKIFSRNLQYLEIHNEKDGLKTFSSETRYDWYVLKNDKVDATKTIIKFQDGTTNIINVNGLNFIPNGEFEKIMLMIAKNGEENVDVIHDYSLYETRKPWMSRTKTEECKYPCVYTVNSKSEVTYYYSSKKHGHYEVPKFVWSNGRISSIGSYVDMNGDYGLTQFAYAIVDKPENLQKIKEVFDTKEFRNLMELCAVGQLTINYKVISMFKKDFWKIFIGELEIKKVRIVVDPKIVLIKKKVLDFDCK